MQVRPALFLVALAMACSSDKPRADVIDPAAPVQVVFAATSGEARVTVELSATARTVARGLKMHRELGPEHGMLFIMHEERDWSFWMRDTLIPLDIVFITRDLTVAGVVRDAVPGSDDRLQVGAHSLYVLEVNAGWTARHGIERGAKVRFENLRL